MGSQDGMVIGWGDIVERCEPYADAYGEFAERIGLFVDVTRERLAPGGTLVAFTPVRRDTMEFRPFQVSFNMTPAERAGLTLPMALAAIQVTSLMGEALAETEAEVPEGLEDVLTIREALLGCRALAKAVMGSEYGAFLHVGPGPEIKAEYEETANPSLSSQTC
jgi:hypothetical protein